MRREGDDLEAIEAELGAPSDAEPGAGEPDDGPPASGPRMVRPPGSGPPEHWLAYIRARVPGLLEPGGPLATAGTGPRPDVIPHGVDAGPPSPSIHEVAGNGTRPRVQASGIEPDAPPQARATPGVASHVPLDEAAARPPTPVTAVAPAPDDPASLGRGGDGAGIPVVGSGDREPTAAGTATDAAASRILADEGVRRPEPEDGSRASSTRSGPGRDDVVASAIAAPSPEATAAAAAVEPSPDRAAASKQTDPWPELAGPKRPDTAPVDPFRTLGPLAPRRPLPPEPASPTEHPRPAAWPAFTDGWLATWSPASRPAEGLGPAPFPAQAWRVEAARPEGRDPVDLPLPAWPALPDDPPDDLPDWPSVDRRQERAARLDLEQRRR